MPKKKKRWNEIMHYFLLRGMWAQFQEEKNMLWGGETRMGQKTLNLVINTKSDYIAPVR